MKLSAVLLLGLLACLSCTNKETADVSAQSQPAPVARALTILANGHAGSKVMLAKKGYRVRFAATAGPQDVFVFAATQDELLQQIKALARPEEYQVLECAFSLDSMGDDDNFDLSKVTFHCPTADLRRPTGSLVALTARALFSLLETSAHASSNYYTNSQGQVVLTPGPVCNGSMCGGQCYTTQPDGTYVSSNGINSNFCCLNGEAYGCSGTAPACGDGVTTGRCTAGSPPPPPPVLPTEVPSCTTGWNCGSCTGFTCNGVCHPVEQDPYLPACCGPNGGYWCSTRSTCGPNGTCLLKNPPASSNSSANTGEVVR